MEYVGRKIGKPEPDHIAFKCPGCMVLHSVPIAKDAKTRWAFNQNGDSPTITPCVTWETHTTYCHCVVSDGEITFFHDSHHHLSGQTVDLPDIGEG